jgi:hypothetical protein
MLLARPIGRNHDAVHAPAAKAAAAESPAGYGGGLGGGVHTSVLAH